MPTRFRPSVLPDRGRDPQSGESIARAVETYYDTKRQEEEDELRREELEYVRGQRERQAFLDELEERDLLEERGLTPALPRDMERAQADRQRQDPDLGSPDLYSGVERRRAPGGGVEVGQRAPTRPENLFSRDNVAAAFQNQAELGPDAASEPALLPGQFASGFGFAKKPIFEDELRPPADLRERVNIRGREFIQGPTRAERLSAAEQEALQQEIDALIRAGVPAEVAGFAAQDATLAREYLGPQEAEEEAGYSPEELEAAGLSPELARLAALSPDLADNVLNEHLRRTRPEGAGGGASVTERRFDRDVAIEQATAAVRQMVSRGMDLEDAAQAVRQVPEWSRHVTPAMVEMMVRDAEGGARGGERDPRIEERRDNIIQLFEDEGKPIVTSWHQGIVDRLAGIGPNGEPIEPMSPEEILEAFRSAGTPEDQLREIEDFLPYGM